ncbi:MAG: DUF348 domain-containing protein [Clostridiales bacterium]|nr:DUF348 domain-containing protein [Clostridiales bacterium]
MESDSWNMFRNKYFIVFLAVLIIFTAIAVGFAQYIKNKSKVVMLDDDGEIVELVTMENTVEDLLKKYNIVLGPHDKIVPNVDTVLEKENEIVIKRATVARIIVDSDLKTVYLTEGTVKDILDEANVKLGEDDLTSHELDTPLTEGLFITVNRITKEFVTETVELSAEKAESDNEYLEHEEVEKTYLVVYQDGEEISRALQEELITQTSRIPFKEEVKNNNKLEIGKQKIVQEGKEGQMEKKIMVTYEDGKETSREVVEETILAKAQDKVVEKGTMKKPEPKPASQPKTTEVASRGSGRGTAQTFRATAYTHTGNRTATGVWPKVGMIAVDPRVIKLGSTVYVEFPKPYSHLNGNYKATDTGGAIKGNIIDVFFETRGQCRQFGRRTVKVFINR